MPDDRFALAVPAPDGSRMWWTGGLRDTSGGGRTLATSPLPGDAMAFPTAEEAREVRETWLAAFPWLAEESKRLAVVSLTEKPAGSGAKVTTTTVKDSLGRVYKLLTAGP